MPRIAVFTTSWPRDEDDPSGRFVADAVERVRRRGVQVSVVRPGTYRDWGIAGHGVVRSLRRRPWAAPLLLASMVRAVRRAGRDADLVHAHWLAGAVIARLARVPFVVTLHGSGTAGRFDDFELARRHPRLVRRLLGRARRVICVSEQLADAMRGAGLGNVTVICNGVDVPARVEEPTQPPHVLFAGRLSSEKGVAEFADATAGLPRVVAGDGPLRELLPDTLGFLDQASLFEQYARSSVVAVPSRREGASVVIAEAMAHGRPVVASRVGGIPTFVEHEVTGLLVAPGDVAALRAAITRLLDDPDEARRMGTAGRERIGALCGWDTCTDLLLAAYRDAAAQPRAHGRRGEG